MTPDRVLMVIKNYRLLFENMGIGKIDYPHDNFVNSPASTILGIEVKVPTTVHLEHCNGMLFKMEEFVKEGRMEKVFRWLGFVQGVLWSNGIYTLNELRNHNFSQKEGGQ